LGTVGIGVVILGKLGYVSLTPPTHQTAEFLALDGHIRAVIFLRAGVGVEVSKTLPYVISHYINISRPRYNFLNQHPRYCFSYQVSQLPA
jgi:hypothetical protein